MTAGPDVSTGLWPAVLGGLCCGAAIQPRSDQLLGSKRSSSSVSHRRTLGYTQGYTPGLRLLSYGPVSLNFRKSCDTYIEDDSCKSALKRAFRCSRISLENRKHDVGLTHYNQQTCSCAEAVCCGFQTSTHCECYINSASCSQAVASKLTVSLRSAGPSGCSSTTSMPSSS